MTDSSLPDPVPWSRPEEENPAGESSRVPGSLPREDGAPTEPAASPWSRPENDAAAGDQTPWSQTQQGNPPREPAPSPWSRSERDAAAGGPAPAPFSQTQEGGPPGEPPPVSWPPLEEESSLLSWPVPNGDRSILGRWKSLPLPVRIGVIVAVVALLVIVAVLTLRDGKGGNGVAPTPDATALSEFVVPTTDALVVDSGTPQPQAQVPVSITLKGLEYTVLPYQIQPDGEWQYPAGQSGTAVWVYGTIVNFAIGIEQTRANLTLLQSLAPGDQVTMTMSNGAVYRFGFAGRGQLASADLDIFDQTRPGLTLVSLGGAKETRLVIYGEFLGIAEEGRAGRSGMTAYSVGEPAALGSMRVTALETSYLYDDPRVPTGWAFFLVDYQIENLSQEVLDPNRFRMELQDSAGNSYSLNLPASQAGPFGFLSLTIPPNTVAQGTAGYLVPAPLQGPQVSWSFSRLDVPDRVIKVLIDFESPQEVIDPRQLAAVDLLGAELSGDRTLLSVWGTVLNDSEQELVADTDQVALEGAGAAMALRAADPALPWTIEPGGVLSFRVTFQRPNSPVATFTVLGKPFEISGLD